MVIEGFMSFFRNLVKLSYIATFLLSSSIVMAGGVKDAVNQVKDRAVQNAFSYGDNAIESWARDNLTSLRLIEVETRSRADSKPTFRAITLFELTGNEFDKILSQISKKAEPARCHSEAVRCYSELVKLKFSEPVNNTLAFGKT